MALGMWRLESCSPDGRLKINQFVCFFFFKWINSATTLYLLKKKNVLKIPHYWLCDSTDVMAAHTVNSQLALVTSVLDLLSPQTFRFLCVDRETCPRVLPQCCSSFLFLKWLPTTPRRHCTCCWVFLCFFFSVFRKQAPWNASDIHLENEMCASQMGGRMTGIMLYFLCDGGIQLCFCIKQNDDVFFFSSPPLLGLLDPLTVKFNCELERWWAIFSV